MLYPIFAHLTSLQVGANSPPRQAIIAGKERVLPSVRATTARSAKLSRFWLGILRPATDRTIISNTLNTLNFLKQFRGEALAVTSSLVNFGTPRRRRMASHKKASPGTPADGPEKHSDDAEQSLARYATIVGIVTGLFGMLFGVGLILLPSATIRERVLVIGASLAVSVAGLTGVGAWRSRRKFGLTAFAGGLAIVCLAGLSVVAASGGQSTARAAVHGSSDAQPGAIRKTESPKIVHGSSSASASPHSAHRASSAGNSYLTHGPSTTVNPHPTPSASTGSSGAVDPVFLSELPAHPGSDQRWVAPIDGSWSIKSTKYGQSLGYSNLCNHNTAVIYDLGKPYRNFLAEVGVADGWSAQDDGIQATFTVDAGTGAGTFTFLTSGSAEGGYPSLLDQPLPAGTTELELTTSVMDAACMQDSTIVWGNARLTS
jgi:uncharacterized membrane protein